MRVIFDETVDVLTILLRDGDYDESDEVTEGIIVDFDREGKPMAIEILDASRLVEKTDRIVFEFT